MILLRETLMAATLVACCVATDPANQDDKKSPIKFELRRAESKPAAGLTEAVVEGTKQKVYLYKEVVITNREIAEAQAATDNSNNRKRPLLRRLGASGRLVVFSIPRRPSRWCTSVVEVPSVSSSGGKRLPRGRSRGSRCGLSVRSVVCASRVFMLGGEPCMNVSHSGRRHDGDRPWCRCAL